MCRQQTESLIAKATEAEPNVLEEVDNMVNFFHDECNYLSVTPWGKPLSCVPGSEEGLQDCVWVWPSQSIHEL